ncbi:MAG TPA: hypothetical protein PK530_19790, partial [Anaerolineales bacterium]|nr:hypothetical protein [Anaerolineales bacterium]
NLSPTTDPAGMAQLLVQSYAETMPLEEHPHTISAVDTSFLPQLAADTDQLAVALSQTFTSPAQATLVQDIYSQTQKLDYDTDLQLETATDGFVDLYDFALRLTQQHPDPDVISAAEQILTTLDQAILAEAHQSGAPWSDPTHPWNLDNTHGLSIFLPFGEDLEISTIQVTETIQISPTITITRNLRLRELYSATQLDFVQDTAWETMIQAFYDAIPVLPPPTVTINPIAGLQNPDNTAPATALNLTGNLLIGSTITLHWDSEDGQSGLDSLTLWHRGEGEAWTEIATVATSSGDFQFTLQQFCRNDFAILGTDQAGNIEIPIPGLNTWYTQVQPCYPQMLPIIFR